MSVKRWTINLSVNTPARTLSHGPPPATKNVGQQHFSRMAVLYSGVRHVIKTEMVITHRRLNPRAFHAEAGLSSGIAAAFAELSFQFEN